LLTPEQVEQALRAQVVWGGRLGTNLVELGLIDLDALARALGRQRGMPAALARHFDKADAELQARLTAEQADRWSIVPLLRVGPGKIAVAAMDPIGPHKRAAIAEALSIAPDELVVSIAGEQRVKYQLERVYGLTRSARFLRAKGPTIPLFPHLGDVQVPVDSDPEVAVEEPTPPPRAMSLSDAVPQQVDASEAGPIETPADTLAELIDQAASRTAEPATTDARTGRERRTYVRTLADVEPGDKAIGRIEIRKVAPGQLPRANDPGPATTLTDATRAIRRGRHRERVAELVVDAIDRFAPMCRAAIVMVVRGGIALSWKSFCRSEHVPPELAVPLGAPGLVPNAIEHNAIARGAADDLGAIDLLLLRALGEMDGDLVIVPVPISGRVICLIAAATQREAPVAELEAIAAAAGHGFARLVRDASR
jgi:hypothetical protein